MVFSILRTIQAWSVPDHRIRCTRRLWRRIHDELRRRGRGSRESGAFLLGSQQNGRRSILDVVYYDDVAPDSLRFGAILVPSRAYSKLWEECRHRGLEVVADVHTHPGGAYQSSIDSAHPMISERGHVAFIIPTFAMGPAMSVDLGVYEYQGAGSWRDFSGPSATRYFLRTV
jgi:proteasome lid subunit RPN8/RPN11